MHLKFLLFSLTIFFLGSLQAQNVNIEGYVFEDGNRGFLNLASVTIVDQETGLEKGVVNTDMNGVFKSIVPANRSYVVFIEKDLFQKFTLEFDTNGKAEGEKVFLKCEMQRKPGYIFDVTLAKKRDNDSIVVDALKEAYIEVYNNTKDELILSLKDHPEHTFKVHFEDENHYTILIRKAGYFNKRMEAFVNVKGCILCFEGVGEVKPSDVLSEGNTMGTLVANVEMEPIEMNKGTRLENIYYEYASSKLTDQGKYSLDKLINLLNNNPSLIIELGSHTDSRGDDDYNMRLSQDRAISAVDYVIANSTIARNRIRAAGYGESTLYNKCANGVQCSENDHALNRRTELKVVGTIGLDPFSGKTLKDIIEEEKMEALLAEITSEDAVVRFNEGDELPDEIKKQIGGADEIEKERDEEKVVDEVVEEVQEIEQKIEDAEPTDLVQESMDQGANQVIEEDLTQAMDATKAIERVEEVVVEEMVVEEKPAVIEEVAIETIADGSEAKVVSEKKEPMLIQTGGATIVDNYAVSVRKRAANLKSIEKNFTGYRVEFMNSNAELPGSHEIFMKHGNITLERSNDGSFSYMLGDFQEEKDAQDFLQNIILPQYPDARMLKYKKGNRIKL